ncbi:MAG: hypothetical protein J2P25_03820 [Nocardiopsaceae bacterium]|nr:hypothetical protein [Nocardiopsaceae bacterium]
MSGIEVQAMIVFFILLVMGVFVGIVAISSLAYRREDRRGSLSGQAPDAMCRGARRLTGVGFIGPAGWVLPEQPDDDGDGAGDSDGESEGDARRTKTPA